MHVYDNYILHLAFCVHIGWKLGFREHGSQASN